MPGGVRSPPDNPGKLTIVPKLRRWETVYSYGSQQPTNLLYFSENFAGTYSEKVSEKFAGNVLWELVQCSHTSACGFQTPSSLARNFIHEHGETS